MRSYKNQLAITGAVTGLGAAIAMQLSLEGVKLALRDQNSEMLQQLFRIMRKVFVSICFMVTTFCNASNNQQAQIQLKNLKLENLNNPIGIDILKPRFKWQIQSDLQNINQIAYQIMVADSPEKLKSKTELTWNSGRVESDKSINIEYAGILLQSQTDYYWKVKIWTNKGEATSSIATWSMAFTNTDEWKASWIGLDSLTNVGDSIVNQTRLAARYLRKEFILPNSIKRARLYITGLGLYECFINGQKVGADVLAPALTDYLKRVNYNVYDVSDLLKKNNNTIGVILGNGYFVPVRVPTYEALRKKIGAFRNFGFPKLLMQLEIEYVNGEKTTIVSDESWKITAHGPVIANNAYDGEVYNANYELKGWDKNGFEDAKWINARKVAAPAGKVIAQRNPNLRIMEELNPISIKEVKPNCYVLDMGQNMVGWLAIKLKGVLNHPITLRFAESPHGKG
jgi:alpha-L-rhamnosidase